MFRPSPLDIKGEGCAKHSVRGVPWSNRMRMFNLGVQALHLVLQHLPHLPLLYAGEPIEKVLDCGTFRKIAE